MSWLKNHSDSEKFASLADSAIKNGNISEAEKMFKQAGESEEKALSFIDLSKKRTLGITAVSSAALYFKGKDFVKAEHIAHN